jgi:L-threonylcarbamoyladenylate synthase
VEELEASASGVARAAALIRSGEVIAFPTDTVYGLAALASDAAARRRIYEIKGRSLDQPLILMAAGAPAFELWVEIDARARGLMERFWPGPLTLVLPAPAAGFGATQSLRIPAHPAALLLLETVGDVLATTSCNRTGEAPALSAADAKGLPGLAAVLDGGPSPGGQASTLLDLTGKEPRILRPGPVTEADIAASIQ